MIDSGSSSAIVDLNGNGISDIWEIKYNASGVASNADTDGDGRNTFQESIAGTDPFNPQSFFAITSLTSSGNVVSVGWFSLLGKSYQVQTSTDLVAAAWNNQGGLLAGTGGVMTTNMMMNGGRAWVCIAVQDMDTAGSGVSDWEKLQIGLDPTKQSSNNQLDSNGQPMSDYAYVTNQLASENVVTISADNPTAIEPDPSQSSVDMGSFTISRGGFPLNAITVNLSIHGPGNGLATEGLDFSPLPRLVTFPVGVSSQSITVTPLADTNLQAAVVAGMTIQPGTGYTAGGASNAGVVIYPSPTPIGTGLWGMYYLGSSTNYTNSVNFNPANLKLTRVDPTNAFSWGSSATLPITNSGTYCVRWPTDLTTGLLRPRQPA